MKPPVPPVPPASRYVRDDDSISRRGRKADRLIPTIIIAVVVGCLLGCVGTNLLYMYAVHTH